MKRRFILYRRKLGGTFYVEDTEIDLITNKLSLHKVGIRLLVNGDSLRVAQMEMDSLFLDVPVDHSPGEATIVLVIDGSERRWKVKWPEGISATSERVKIAPRA
jgi:hypothetical protein